MNVFYIFFFVDVDNEMIIFLSDEELVEVLGSISGDVFCVFVKGGELDVSNVGKMLYFFYLFVY